MSGLGLAPTPVVGGPQNICISIELGVGGFTAGRPAGSRVGRLDSILRGGLLHQHKRGTGLSLLVDE